MADASSPAATPPMRRPPAIIYKVLNPLMGAILRSPLHGLLDKRLLVLSFVGRKSGKRYNIPVGYSQRDNLIQITTQAKWSRNLVGGKSVLVWLRGQRRAGVADLVTDEDGLYEAYSTMLRESPQLGQIIGVGLDANGLPKRTDVANARQRGYVIVKITLD